MDESRIVSISEVCGNLNRSPRTIWQWVKDGKFPKPISFKGRTMGWTEEVYNKWFKELLQSNA